MRLVPLLALFALAACEIPTPLAPAEPIGTPPTWGEGFATPTEAPQSALAGGQALPPGQSPGSTGEWGGGDATLGKGVYTALCARCHGALGEGGTVPGVGSAPALADASMQKLTDREMARSIALGKNAMPAFMAELDKAKLSGVIAYIRTLKK
jgi:mono/diheme cytochrome c family protein